jgi:hypothetical protein
MAGSPLAAAVQPPVLWARHLRLPFFPAHAPEQRWAAALQAFPASRQPNAFGLGIFLRFFAATIARRTPRLSQAEARADQAPEDVAARWSRSHRPCH